MEGIKTYWFLSAKFSGGLDQTERFIKDGIWENGYEKKFLNIVRSIAVGEKVAIKSTYNLKNNLPFNNKGQPVSVMEIKAIGTVTKNHQDGKLLEIDWQKTNLNKKWYFYTNLSSIWSVKDDFPLSKQLIDFTFYDKPQNIDYFRNAPYWKSRYGDEDDYFQYDDDIDNDDVNQQSIVKQNYNLIDLIKEGCFVDEQLISKMISSLNRRKNIILQGPPGTGKTWLAKRLANIIVGYKNSNNIKSIQFHPGMSYEDFIRGYRPSSDGKLVLVDGPFLEMINMARNDSQSNYVIIIEEINRGNPAQILGEMLTLLEADKRTPSEALELTYRREHENGLFIPNNLYVIGTMNLADRSLAMVDFALRRRFAFFNLSPNFDESWLNYMIEKTKLSRQILEKIKNALNDLNQYVTDERMLGSAFTIGHSYLTHDNVIPDALSWYTDIIDSEIKPLLEEYWFDDKNKLETALNKLVLNDL